LTYTALNRAFRFLLDGAAFITLARNRYFRGRMVCVWMFVLS